ncbi:hypothetical protein ACR6C2_05160 [Streptomyces sp. INA 01156]
MLLASLDTHVEAREEKGREDRRQNLGTSSTAGGTSWKPARRSRRTGGSPSPTTGRRAPRTRGPSAWAPPKR